MARFTKPSFIIWTRFCQWVIEVAFSPEEVLEKLKWKGEEDMRDGGVKDKWTKGNEKGSGKRNNWSKKSTANLSTKSTKREIELNFAVVKIKHKITKRNERTLGDAIEEGIW